MTTESDTSLETMLDQQAGEAAPQAPSSQPTETGDTSSAAPPADADTQAEPRDESPSVPRKALEDERRKRQELERRLADLEKAAQPQQQQQRQPQQQQQPLTQEELERLWWENPAQAAAIVQHIAAQNAVQQAQRAMLSRELDRSERRARKAHGDEVIATALEQAKLAGRVQSFLDDDDPYQSLVDWYNETLILRDPQAAKEKLRAELMAEMGLNPAAPKPAAKAPVPKSLASRVSEQPRNDRGQYQGRASLDDILG